VLDTAVTPLIRKFDTTASDMIASIACFTKLNQSDIDKFKSTCLVTILVQPGTGSSKVRSTCCVTRKAQPEAVSLEL
jgi:hypothetical protein